ncbi:MAG: RDD family protein [Nitrospirota bacterium]
MQIDSKISLELEKEKKKNIKLAIGVAALGIFAFFALYIVMFALMFLKPGIFFGMMPFPTLSKEVIGIGDKLYIISKEVDFSDIAFDDRKQPEERFLLSVFDGRKVSNTQEIKPFHSFKEAGNTVYFFDNGLYRTFDGLNWTETRSNAIGENPYGAVSREGLFVLSYIKSKPVLNLIKGAELIYIPLPEEYPSDKQACANPPQLLWFQDRLYIFWLSGQLLHMSVFNGEDWDTAESHGYHGSIKIISDDKRIYLFNGQFSEKQRINFTAYEDGSWHESAELNIQGLFIDWSPVIHHDKLLLLVRGFFSEHLYTLENGIATNPVRLEHPFFKNGYLWKILRLILIGNLIFFIFIYLISAFIQKFKLRTWKINSDTYEFATLFRRFMAKIIDSVILMLPPAIFFAAYFLNASSSSFNPLRIFLFVFLTAGYFLTGGFLYHSLLEGLYGKTPGKKICGITVLKDDFSRCGLLAGFLRNLMRIVDGFFYYLVAVVTMAGTLKWQRLGDIVAGTVVVKKRKA